MDDRQASAPGRAVLIGDHTDHDGGLSLPFALPLRTRVHATAPLASDRPAGAAGTFRVSSRDAAGPVTFRHDDPPGTVTGWAAYVAGVAWAIGRSGVTLPPVELEVAGDVPQGMGLSSSHALQVAAAVALLRSAGAAASREELVQLVSRAENAYVGVPSGTLDQTAILWGRAGHLVLVDAAADADPSRVRAQQVPCDLDAAGLVVLVVPSGAVRSLGEGGYAGIVDDLARARRTLGVDSLRCEADRIGDADLLARLDAELFEDEAGRRRARHVVTENARVRTAVDLCRADRPAEIGEVMTQSHRSMREDLRNSHDLVDLVVETALAAGALGARMSGGGFGGAVVVLARRDDVTAIEAALGRTWAARGLQAPACLPVVPSDGADGTGATG